MKMEFTLGTKKQVNYFKNILDLILNLGDEIPLHITSEGINVLGMDPSHVAMIDLKLGNSIFEKYEVEPAKNKEEIILTLSLNELKKRIEAIEADDETARIYYNIEKERLVLHLLEHDTRRRRELEIPLLESLDDEVPLPKIIFHGQGKIMLEDVNRALKDASFVSEHIKISFHEDKLRFDAQGDMGSAFLELPKDQITGFKIDNDKNLAVATFTLSWISGVMSDLPKFVDEINISMSTDMPLRVEAEKNSFEFKYYLAPCIGV